eukprot:gene9279-11374_t
MSASTNSRFQLRKYNGSSDKKSISTIPRIPVSYNTSSLDALSHPIDFGLRATLTQKNKIMVAEDKENSMAVGAYACNIKDMRVFGQKRTVYYAFDFNVDPKFRNQSISQLFFKDLDQSLLEDTTAPILFGSSAKSNSPIKKNAGKINLFHYCDQRQCAWKVDEMIPMEPLEQPQYSIRIWEESKSENIKMRWNNAFKNFNFTPYDFNDLIEYNHKYHLTTYVATLKRGSSISEASISVWDQDLLFTLKDTTGLQQKHRQLFSCYALGEDKDLLFSTLLKHVHNEQLKQNVSYLFVGFATTDPVAKYFPLIKGIKNLEFSAYLRVNSSQEMSVFNEAIEKNVPLFNDPRDFGTTVFYKDIIETPRSKL